MVYDKIIYLKYQIKKYVWSIKWSVKWSVNK